MRTLLIALSLALAIGCSKPTSDGGSNNGGGSNSAITEGIFYGVRTNLVTDQTIKVYVTFLADGRVFMGYPKEGLGTPVVWERECRFAPCGTYTRKGEEVVMHWTGDAPRNETFRLDSEGVLHTTVAPTTSYRRLALMEGTLEGRYGITGTDPNYAVTEITFSRDGRFSDEYVVWYTGWDTESSGSESFQGGQGTYTIQRGTLTLRYDDGKTVSRLIMVPPAGDVESSVQIGGNRDYLRIR